LTNGAEQIEHQIIGQSELFRTAIENAKKIAKTSSITVLIQGESGTGKEMLARLIHEQSNLAQQPFVDINCGAIPENLLESELFGYEKGAFTGANRTKPGLFEMANGGTIFLDEIANTSINFQVKLLKIVENKKNRRIGGLEELSVSTRVITASNINLLDAVKDGTFREDLYYRLNVYKIEIPPLRKRGEDVILLSGYFIEHFNREYGREIKGLNAGAEGLIRKYPWPGNVRQLRNAMERAVLVESKEWIEPKDMFLDLSRHLDTKSRRKTGEQQKLRVGEQKFEIPTEGVSFENLEREIIMSSLRKAKGNLSKAARLLQINRGKFRYRMEKLGIKSEDFLE
jgi:transcriptional regulator with PAS, ATPase and Fis domain